MKSIENSSVSLDSLNKLMRKCDVDGIRSFPKNEKKSTFDDWSYLLIGFTNKKIILSVWDSDELWDNPKVVSVQEI